MRSDAAAQSHSSLRPVPAVWASLCAGRGTAPALSSRGCWRFDLSKPARLRVSPESNSCAGSLPRGEFSPLAPSSPLSDANRAQERHVFGRRSTPRSNFEVSDDLWHSGKLRQPPRIESPCFQKIEKSRAHPPLLPTPPLASQAPPPTPAAKAVGIFGSPPSRRTQARAPGPAEGAGSMGRRAGSVPRPAPASRATQWGTPKATLGPKMCFYDLYGPGIGLSCPYMYYQAV